MFDDGQATVGEHVMPLRLEQFIALESSRAAFCGPVSVRFFVRRHRDELTRRGVLVPGRGRRESMFLPGFLTVAVGLMLAEEQKRLEV